MECQPQSSPPEPCPLYWSCQISRGHSIKSEFQISKKCMGSLNDYLLLTHTHTHTHTHIYSQAHACAHANPAWSYQRLGFLPTETPTGELSELGRVPPGRGIGALQTCPDLACFPLSCGKVLLLAIQGGTQGWAVGQADSPAFPTPLFALDLGMKQPRGWNV